MELLARAAARPAEPSCPAHVDESRLCGSPGKIVDPITLYHILKLPSSSHVFYGAGNADVQRCGARGRVISPNEAAFPSDFPLRR